MTPTSLKLLLVDDSPQDRQLFECLLDDFRRECAVGIDCELAASGPVALALMDHQHYDAVILDQHMPEMTGSEVLSALNIRFRQRDDRPKVLAYSTLDAPEFRHRCLAEGADAFMPKYMGARDFARVMRELGFGTQGAERSA